MKLELGKYYRTREGFVVGPVERTTDPRLAERYPWRIASQRITYTDAGRVLAEGHGGLRSDDLVAEATPQEISGVHWPAAVQIPDPETTPKPDGYEPLAAVLIAALEQASAGKGHERHSRGEPFVQQPIMTIGRRRGVGFLFGQADKKTLEAQGMLDRAERQAARREILGAINYLAAAILWIDEQG